MVAASSTTELLVSAPVLPLRPTTMVVAVLSGPPAFRAPAGPARGTRYGTETHPIPRQLRPTIGIVSVREAV